MGTESSAPESPGESAGASGSPTAQCNATAGTPTTGGEFDPSTISGNAELGHWDSSPAENEALDCALQGFAATYPNITVKNTTEAGDYVAQMVTLFGSTPPDLFYVNGDTVIDWAQQGFLLPLDDYISKTGFDMTNFYPGYQDTFKVDGQTYGIAKDGNTIAMAYNTDLVPNPPTTLDELVSWANQYKTDNPGKTPMCLNPGLDRGLAFIYAQGGSLISDDNTTEQIDTDASKQAVQWYMDLFKDGLGAPAPSGSWCGEQLGKGNAAIVFEGGWLKGFMDSTYPDVNWQFAEVPTGSIGQPMTITYTAAYGIGADSVNKDQGWTVLQYLTGVDGMKLWTEGGIAVPSRSDVPVPEGFDVITKGAEYAKPGVLPIPHFGDVTKAFGDAFLAEVTNGTYSADPVVSATAQAITTAVGGGQ
jgi:multiple sugar transport system substrate-binding protein